MPSAFLRSLPPEIVEERRTTSLWTPSWGVGRSDRRKDGEPPRARGASPVPSFRPPDLPPDEPSQDSPRYVKGERVRHRRFGSGTIQGLTGTGRDLKVSVAFDDAEVGVKQLLVAFAGLEREWESA